MSLRVGTRGSPLALAQTALVTAALAARGLRPEVTLIRTQGDRLPDRPSAALGVGAFVKDLEAALIEGRIDVAVHSAKDLPGGASPEELVLAAFLPREDPRDVLITRDGVGLRDLPTGAVIGTDSPRRRAFLLAARPDLTVSGLRGNVDTRLRKLDAGVIDGLIVAAAGLARLGLRERVTEFLDPAVMLPSVGQGAIVIQVRATDHPLRDLVADLDHRPTRLAVYAERACVAALGGGCQRPIAALATCAGDRLVLDGAVAEPLGGDIVRDQIHGPIEDAEALGRALAARLLARGAARLLLEVAT